MVIVGAWMRKLVSLALAVAAAGALSGCDQKPKTSPPPASAAYPQGWQYQATTDEMSGKKIYSACIVSENAVALAAPYHPAKARLCLRDHPRTGGDLLISLLGPGQVMCGRDKPCEIRIRYDDGEPQTAKAVTPSDGSTNVVIIENDLDRHVMQAQMGQSAATRIELEFYQAGFQVLTFKTKGMDFTKTGAL